MGAENYFFTRFKRRYGMSPLQYRIQAGAKTQAAKD
jgi:AraC-like DNA-binding protein